MLSFAPFNFLIFKVCNSTTSTHGQFGCSCENYTQVFIFFHHELGLLETLTSLQGPTNFSQCAQHRRFRSLAAIINFRRVIFLR